MLRIKSILWKQDEDASKNGYLVVNKELISNPDDNLYHLINRKLLKIFSLSVFDEAMVKKYMAKSSNRYFQLGSGLFKGVAYRSCFLEKDEKGNEEPFMFWKSSFHIKGFAKDAIDAASTLGKTLESDELKFVEKYIRRIRVRRIAFCVFLLATVVLALILIL